MNKKIIALILAALAVVMCFAFAACGGEKTTDGNADTNVVSDLADIKAKGTLVVGMTVYEPMNYKDADGNWTGFDTEFAQAVAKELGVDVEFIVIDWDNKFFELESKKIDCIWNGMTITEEALKNASVSDAYVKNAQVVVMQNSKLADYADAASLKDLSFVAEAGSAGEAEIQALEIENYTAVSDQAAALLEVASGKADACVLISQWQMQ